MVLLCENNTGYQNLIKLWCRRPGSEGFYNKPRVDRRTAGSTHSEGLIALSACLAGEIPRALVRGDYDAAKETALKYSRIFGQENFYLELQDHGIREQKQIAPDADPPCPRRRGFPWWCTNDCHYIHQEDSQMQKVLLCIQTNHTVDDDNDLEFEIRRVLFQNRGGDAGSLFPQVPEALRQHGENRGACAMWNLSSATPSCPISRCLTDRIILSLFPEPVL